MFASRISAQNAGLAPSLQAIGGPVLVGTSSSAIVVDSPANKVYVANYYSNNVSVISTVSHALFYTLPTGANPSVLLADQQDNILFVGNSAYYGPHGDCQSPCPANGTVTMYSTSTDALLGSVQVGVQPISMAFSPHSDELLVANEMSSNISIISATQGRLVGSLPLPSYVLLADPASGMVYSAGARAVSVINSSTNTVVATIAVGGFPEYPVLNPWNSDLYVGNPGSNTVEVISTVTNRLVATIAIAAQPGLMTLDSLNGDLIVASNEFTNERQFFNGTLTVISGLTNRVLSTQSIVSHFYGLAMDNATRALYLLSYGNLTVFDGSTAEPLYTDPVSSTAYLIGVDLARGAIYIVNPCGFIGVPGSVDIYAAPLPIAPAVPPGLPGLPTLVEPVLAAAIVAGMVIGVLVWFRSERVAAPGRFSLRHAPTDFIFRREAR